MGCFDLRARVGTRVALRAAEAQILRLLSTALISLLTLCPPGFSQEPDAEAFFKIQCVACHNIGSPGILGPDLAGVTERQTREWLVPFMMDPPAVLASGDPYAQELLAAANNVQMIKIPGMDAAMANALLDYIEAQSGADPKPAPVVETEPFTAEEINSGREYFTGAKSLENGAPACTACHTTYDIGSWGGGRLGPDLTHVSQRLQGRAGLQAWLTMPASAVMTPIFSKQRLTKAEIRDLVAFLESENEKSPSEAPAVTASFFSAGVIVAILLLVMFGLIWKNRYRSTRIPMVERAKR